ncbi:MAG TPA: response regulator [Longimicrobium sp.]|nr:response regulator [Longimicrobium sp.]
MSTPLVLLVDAHDDSRAIYAAILRHAGYAVAAAVLSDDGLSQARQQRPDLVVLGLTPPRAAALHCIRCFRGEPATAAVPLLALSTVPAPDEREVLIAEGITAYLPKPCTPLQLLAEVRRLLAA